MIKGVPENHWARKAYEEMFSDGLIVGYPYGVMHPDSHLTEAQMVALLHRMKKKLDLQDRITYLIGKYSPGVVRINVKCEYANEKWEQQGSGSFINKDGYILTNKHVTDFGKEFIVDTAFGTLPGKFVVNAGAMTVEDSSVDLSIIKVDVPERVKVIGEPTVIPWRWDSDPPAGAFCLVLGSPLGERSTTFGMITDQEPDEWLLTQAPINPGNSGGICILIEEGRACGVPTRKAGGMFVDNMGYLTPASTVKKFLDEKFAGRF